MDTEEIFLIQKGPYRKHIYWLTEDEEACLTDELGSREIKIKSAKGIVCTPLYVINKISSVAPDVWNDTCARQGNRYRTSGSGRVSLKNGSRLEKQKKGSI